MFSFDLKKIDWNNQIGSGSSGRVYPYKKTPEDERFVVKTAHVDDSELPGYIQEIVLGFSCQHENVLPVRGYHIDYDNQKRLWGVYIKLDRMKSTLKAKLHEQQRKGQNFSQKEIVNYFYEMSCGLEYLHNKGIAHRDVKPANVLISENGQLKIADIGSGKFVGDENSLPMGSIAGTFSYMAPEITNQDAPYLRRKDLFKTDIWSLGVIMAELCLMEINITKFGHENEYNIVRKLKRLEGKYDAILLDLIANLLRTDPTKRKSLQDIQKDLREKYGKDLKDHIKMQNKESSSKNEDLEEMKREELASVDEDIIKKLKDLDEILQDKFRISFEGIYRAGIKPVRTPLKRDYDAAQKVVKQFSEASNQMENQDRPLFEITRYQEQNGLQKGFKSSSQHINLVVFIKDDNLLKHLNNFAEYKVLTNLNELCPAHRCLFVVMHSTRPIQDVWDKKLVEISQYFKKIDMMVLVNSKVQQGAYDRIMPYPEGGELIVEFRMKGYIFISSPLGLFKELKNKTFSTALEEITKNYKS